MFGLALRLMRAALIFKMEEEAKEFHASKQVGRIYYLFRREGL